MDQKTVNSTLPWPINGGRPVTSKQTKSDHENVMLTGHEDGSGKFYCFKYVQIKQMQFLKQAKTLDFKFDFI